MKSTKYLLFVTGTLLPSTSERKVQERHPLYVEDVPYK
jgi:hypothetical protein